MYKGHLYLTAFRHFSFYNSNFKVLSSAHSSSSTEYKVVILGDSGVGKTSIFDKYFIQGFDPTVEPTIGAAYMKSTLEINETKITLSIWDTAGQERFQSLLPLYMRNARGIIFVFDVAAEHSLGTLKQIYDSLSDQLTSDMIFVLCGNKIDLVDELDLDLSEYQSWANSHQMVLVKTSAKTGQGVQELFRQVAGMIIDKGDSKNDRTDIILKDICQEDEQSQNSGCC